MLQIKSCDSHPYISICTLVPLFLRERERKKERERERKRERANISFIRKSKCDSK